MTRTFEKIGLDRIVIAGFRILRMNFEKLRSHKNVELDEQGDTTYKLDDKQYFRKLKIIDNCFFGTLLAGTKKGKSGQFDYAHLDITIGNPKTGNLHNLSLTQYRHKIIEIISYLNTEYGIVIDPHDIRIHRMEINCTFRITDSFPRYHRALRLLMYNLPNSYQKITQILKKNTAEYSLDAETFYRGNQSMQIKIYDKKRQLEDVYKYYSNDNLIRIEFVLLTPQKIREAFGDNKLNQLTADGIIHYYYKQFVRLFEKPYRKWQKNNQLLLIKLIKKHKALNATYWQRNILSECRNQEQKALVPTLLDINNLLQAIKSLEKNGHYKRVEKSLLSKCKPDDIYLQGDSQKIEEIITTVTRIYEEQTATEDTLPQTPYCGEPP